MNYLKQIINFWEKFGFSECENVINNIPVGAATFSQKTIDAVLNNKKYIFPFICCRPSDNHNTKIRKLFFSQIQVIGILENEFFLKNNLHPIKLAYQSLFSILGHHSFEAFPDNWNAPTMKSYGNGWEYRVNSLEVIQVTKFNKFLGQNVQDKNIYEYAYGLDRLYFLNDLNFDSNNEFLSKLFNDINNNSNSELLKKILQLKQCNTYDEFSLANLYFNILDSRNLFNIFEKNIYMKFISNMLN